MHPDDLKKAKDAYMGAVQTKKGYSEPLEVRLRDVSKDGQYIDVRQYVSFSLRPLKRQYRSSTTSSPSSHRMHLVTCLAGSECGPMCPHYVVCSDSPSRQSGRMRRRLNETASCRSSSSTSPATSFAIH
jgi:hypothetical protein